MEEGDRMAARWIDISVPLYSGMVHWPDNPPVRLERVLDMDKGDVCHVSNLSLGVHTGTHMDAPFHFIREGEGIEALPLKASIGRARVLQIHNPERITVEELEPHQIRRGERVLFKTRNSPYAWNSDTFVEDFVYLSQDAARYLAARQVRTVGVDYLSVGGFKVDGPETHQALLSAGVWVIEGLNLDAVEPGIYLLVCLPLKIMGGDGAPARAVVRPIEG